MSAQPNFHPESNSPAPWRPKGSASQLQVPMAISIGTQILAGNSYKMNILTSATPDPRNGNPTDWFIYLPAPNYTISYEMDGNLLVYNYKGEIVYPSDGKRRNYSGITPGMAVFGSVDFSDGHNDGTQGYGMSFAIKLYDSSNTLYSQTDEPSTPGDYFEQYGCFYYIDGADLDSNNNFKFRLCTTELAPDNTDSDWNTWTDLPDSPSRF